MRNHGKQIGNHRKQIRNHKKQIGNHRKQIGPDQAPAMLEPCAMDQKQFCKLGSYCFLLVSFGFLLVSCDHEAIEGFCNVIGDIWDALNKAKTEGDPVAEVERQSRKMFIADCEKWIGCASLFLRNWQPEA